MNRTQLLQDTFRRFVTEGLDPGYENGACVYLTEDGNRCALGHCIPDDETEMLISLGGAEDLKMEHPEGWKRVFGNLNVHSAMKVQKTHDTAADSTSTIEEFRREVEDNLRRLANVWKVKLPKATT